MKKFDVVGIGGTTVDHLNVVDHFPEKDEKIVPLWSSIQGGGQAATAIACLGRLGAKTAFIGTVGEGALGQASIETLKEEGVDTECIIAQEDRAPALSSIIIEDKIGSRTIIADRGDLENMPIEDKMYDVIKNSKFVHSDAHFPDENLKLVKFARENGVPVCMDAEPHTPNSEEFVHHADILIVSRRFVEEKFQQDYEKALHDFIGYGASIAVITLGKYGAIGIKKGEKKCTTVPEYPIEPIVDTTGAGDVFHGAFLYGMLQDWDLRKNMLFGNVCAGLKCRKIGGRLGMPTLEEALEHLEKWKI
jgi:ribokinase